MFFQIHNERMELFQISPDQANRDTAGLMRITR
jgi:hypothetical protein